MALALDTTPLHGDGKLEVSEFSNVHLLFASVLSTCCFHACSRRHSASKVEVQLSCTAACSGFHFCVAGYTRLHCFELAQALPLEARAGNVHIHASASAANGTATATATMQDVAELMRWLEDLGVSSPAFRRLKKRLQSSYNFPHRPSVTIAQANFASLRDILRMDHRQARLQCHVETTAHPFTPDTVKLRQLDSVCTTRSGSGRRATLSGCVIGSTHAVLAQTRVACTQVVTAAKVHVTGSPGAQLALCIADPEDFRANLQGHVGTMAQLGFNANALGILAMLDISHFLGPPGDLVAHFTMLRKFFHPWGDKLADDIRLTKITPACLPAVALDNVHVPMPSAARAKLRPISRLHKALLAGPRSLLQYSPERLEEQMHTLVAAGLCATEEDARRLSLQRIKLLTARSLQRYLRAKPRCWRRVAMTMTCVQPAATNHSLQVTLERLLLYKCARCAAGALPSLLPFPRCPPHCSI